MKSGAELKNVFLEAYKNLNDEQRKAVDTIEGPVMVIAGPGTGKTEILALRIANILNKTDSGPENILALTFTDAGSHNMRERLRRYIGDQSYKVAVHTFHSFAGDLVGRYPDAFPKIIGSRVASDIEKLSLIEEIINSGPYKLLRPAGDPLYYVKKIPDAITDLKKENISPDEFSNRISNLESALSLMPKYHEKGAHKGKVTGAYGEAEKRIGKLKELLDVYRRYEASMREKRLYDFDDIILGAIEALRNNEDMLRDLQETYHYILADEHQDANESQNQILELLADYHDQPNLFVVGDEKQAIYRFQGASLDNFLYWENRFPGTKIISLTDNYRSTEDILSVAYSLIKTDDEALAKLRQPLRANKKETGRSETRVFSHSAIEDNWVVNEVKDALQSGVPADDIAVIVRKNRDVEHFANLLRMTGIDVNPSADSDILLHPITRAVTNLLDAVLSLNDETALFETLLGGWWGTEARDTAKVLASRSHDWPLYRLIGDKERLEELGVDPGRFLDILSLLEDTRNKANLISPHYLLQNLIEKSGLLDYAIKTEPLEGVRVLRRLYDEVETMVVTNQAINLSDVVKQLKYRYMHNLPLTAPFIEQGKNAVNVMTAHKSKGLEFDTVIIPRAHDGAFGEVGRRDYFKLPLLTHRDIPELDAEDDERRLFYVALTRAKRRLLISSSEANSEGKLLSPSRFLTGLEEKALKTIETLDTEFKPDTLLRSNFSSLQLEPSLIKELFLSRGFSVTHLNNYLEDPLKYYNENLLRKPHPRELSLLHGTAMHEVLDRAVNTAKKGNDLPSAKIISEWLNDALGKLPIGTHDLARLHERGLDSLVAFLPRVYGSVTKNTRVEANISVALETNDPELPEIPLTGKLDRIDFDEAGKPIRVVDYKTGKPKSLNEIEGKTKSSNGNYKRQLVFYALLLSLQNKGEPLPKEFTLSFIEPKEKTGEIVEHTFEIEDEEIESLKAEITRVAKEIVSGEKFGLLQ